MIFGIIAKYWYLLYEFELKLINQYKEHISFALELKLSSPTECDLSESDKLILLSRNRIHTY